ncbi:BppU family phage baseplate upper protein [Listeria grandensis]|uniref:BppU family phage baseplate upper protein n=1 Tax=Listeria grandensis TaxID=1494963 RepID=A0A7X0Y5J1_9LIST|nr:SGNH/GDSL hydrolase family protein [Listeria grandensis]MBC1937198.1 BppU family phage baseplate upper protein [Listeria grandensis]
MSDEVFKDLGTTLEVSTSNRASLDLKGAFSTQDIKTARLVFPLTKPKSELQLDKVEAYLYLVSTTLKSESKAVIDVDSATVTYVLADEEIKHSGKIFGELYLRYADGRVLSAHKFHFKIDRALIDQNVEVSASVYNVSIEDLMEKYSSKFDLLEAELYRQLAKYRSLQQELISRGFEKLKAGQAVKILCYGDSLTYGYDIYSADRRPADQVPTSNGTKHVRERASTTYPEALQLALQEVYAGVTVQNWGYSGDTVITSYPHWDGINPNADITLLMLGHNDSKDAKESMSAFLAGYRKIAERALAWGSAIIFLTPPRQKSATDFTVDVYSQAVMQLAKEYQAPVVDMSELTAGIAADFYSDSVHFSAKGYNFIGKKLASIFLGKTLLNSNVVGANDALNVIKEISGVQYKGNCTLGFSAYYPTEDNSEVGKGTALVLNPQGRAYFSFCADENNLLILPTVFAGSGTLQLKVSMDFEAETANNNNSYVFNTTSPRVMNKSLKSTVYTTSDLNWYSARGLHIDGKINASKLIYAARKGYYTICIENLDPTYSVNLFSLEFRSISDVLFRGNYLYTLGTLSTDILLLSAGNYEFYSSGAINMPFVNAALVSLEIYVGGSNRKTFKVKNLVTNATWEGAYNPAASSDIVWDRLVTAKELEAFQARLDNLEGAD